jgi:hypothetical protein
LEEFLRNQEFTQDVMFDSFVPQTFDFGGQPYKFAPKGIGNEKYYNLGLWTWPNKYLVVLYAEEYGLNYDKDIKLNFIDPNFPDEYRDKNLYTHFYDERWDKDRYEVRFNQIFPNEGRVPFDPSKPLIHNLNMLHYSKSAVFYPNGFSVVADICGCKYSLINGSVDQNTYYLNQHP